MRTLGTVCLLGLFLGAVFDAGAAGPDLAVGLTCEQSMVGGGVTVTVPIEFHAGSADGGAPNAISAIDMGVTFAPDAFTVADVRLPDALASSGAWSLDWERTQGLEETPGRVGLALAPAFRFPVPTLPDGPIAELDLVAVANGESRCVPIEIAADSVVLSSPPLGLRVAPGTLTNGGVAITEFCGNCEDDDGDGLVDLADPDCGAGPISFARKKEKVTVKHNKKTGSVLVKIKGSLATALDEVNALEIAVRPDDVEPSPCAGLELPLKQGTGKKTQKFVFSLERKGTVTLVSNARKQRTKLKATLPGIDVPVDAPGLAISLRLGSESFYARLPAGKKLKLK